MTSIIDRCYWFEKYAWWRLVKKAPCFPDVIQKKSQDDIDEEDVDSLGLDLTILNNAYCDGKIEDVTTGDVVLERK